MPERSSDRFRLISLLKSCLSGGAGRNGFARRDHRRTTLPEILECRQMLAAAGYVPNHVLIGLEPTASPSTVSQSLSSVLPGLQMKSLGTYGVQLVTLPSGMSVTTAIESLKAQPGVRYAEPDWIGEWNAVPNDPDFSRLWGLRNTGQTVNGVSGTSDSDIDADQAWNTSTGTLASLVAIVDSGVDYLHPDLAANIWTNTGEIDGNGLDDDGNGYIDDIHGYDFGSSDASPMDFVGHGTHVAGTVGAVGDNGIGSTGVNWHVSMMGLKIGSDFGGPTTSGAIAAINYAVAMGAKVSNHSYTVNDTQALEDAIINAGNNGHIIVAAAGNSASNNDEDASFPASYPQDNVVVVAATDQSDRLASFSNYGVISVDIGAPGVNIWSTTPRNGSLFYGPNYDYSDGTSMAAPHVTGAIAMLQGQAPGLSYTKILEALYGGTDSLSSLAGRVSSGGRLNLAGSLSLLKKAQMTLSAGTLREDSGISRGLLTISKVTADSSAPLTVEVTFDDSSEIRIPQFGNANSGFVTIPAGDTSISLDVQVLDDTLLDGSQYVTLNLLQGGELQNSAVLTITDHETISLTASPAAVAENSGASAASVTVTRNNTDIDATGRVVVVGNQLRQYTASGTLASTTAIPWPSGTRPSGEDARDVVMLNDGRIAIFNGATTVYLSLLNTQTGSWSHQLLNGVSATAADGGSGGLASFGQFVFLSDVQTGTGEPRGLVRVDLVTGDVNRFSGSLSYRDVNVGLDGKVYGLVSDGLTVRQFDPSTLQAGAVINLASAVRTIAVSADSGQGVSIFAGGTAGVVRVFNSAGVQTRLASAGAADINDIELNVAGKLLISNAAGEIIAGDVSLNSLVLTSTAADDAFVSFGEHPSLSTRDLLVTLTIADTTELKFHTTGTGTIQVLIPAGQSSVTVALDAVDDSLRDGLQKVNIQLAAAAYADGGASASIDVTDAEGVLIDVIPASVSEAAGVQPGTIRVTRSDSDGPYDYVSTRSYSVTTPRTILDADTVISTIQVPEQFSTITDVTVTLNIDHSFLGDLDIFLVSPLVTVMENGSPVQKRIRVELFTDLISNGRQMVDTVLDGTAFESIKGASAPYTGRFLPEGDLSNFNGIAPGGVWTLEVTDDSRLNSGTLGSLTDALRTPWKLSLTTAGLTPLKVALASSDTTEITVPQWVEIPAGQKEALAELIAVDDLLRDGTQRVTISVVDVQLADPASGGAVPNSSLGSDSVDVTDSEQLSLTFSALKVSEAAGPNALIGTVTRSNSDNLGQSLVVTLTSSDTTELTVPTSVTIPANARSATFKVNAIDDTVRDNSQFVTISATASGYLTTQGVVIEVTDLEASLQLTTLVSSVPENAGSMQITVTRQNVTDLNQQVTVSLTSSLPTSVTVPRTVRIPVGAASATFTATIHDDKVLGNSRTVVITAKHSTMADGTASIRVTDFEQLKATPDATIFFLENAGNGAAIGTVARETEDISSPLVVNLSSSDTSELTVPKTVTIPANESFVTFSINAVNDSIADGNQDVVITLTATGYAADTLAVRVRDHEPPVLTGPVSETVSKRPTIRWERVSGATRYEVYIDSLTRGVNVLTKADIPATSSSYTPTASESLEVGRYRVWVRAYDSLERPGYWSLPRDFTIKSTLTAPLLLSPTGGSFDATPEFSWSSVAGATNYELWVSASGTPSVRLPDSVFPRDQYIRGTSVTASNDLPNGEYRVWVRAYKNTEIGPWSTSAVFRAGLPPVLKAPVSGPTTANRHVYSWSSVAGAARYELFVTRLNATGSGIENVVSQTGLTATSYTGQTPLAAGKYRVWLRAVSDMGVVTGWSTLVFTVASTDPATPDAVKGLGGQSEVRLTSVLRSNSDDVRQHGESSFIVGQLLNSEKRELEGLSTVPVKIEQHANGLRHSESREITGVEAVADASPADLPLLDLAASDEVMKSWEAAEWWKGNIIPSDESMAAGTTAIAAVTATLAVKSDSRKLRRNARRILR